MAWLNPEDEWNRQDKTFKCHSMFKVDKQGRYNEEGRAGSRGGYHLNPVSWLGDDEGDRRRWREYAEEVRRTPLDPPEAPPSQTVNGVSGKFYLGNNGPLQGYCYHGNPSPMTRRYEQMGPSLPRGLKGVLTKAPSSEKKHLWAALEIGGHSPVKESPQAPAENPQNWQPALDMSKIRPKWSVERITAQLRTRLQLRKGNWRPQEGAQESAWRQFGFGCKQKVDLTCDELRQCVEKILIGALSDEEARCFFESYADEKDASTVELARVIHNVTVGRPLLLADFTPLQGKSKFWKVQAPKQLGFQSKYGISRTPSRVRSPRGQIDNGNIGYQRSPTQLLRFGHVHDLPGSPDDTTGDVSGPPSAAAPRA